MKKQGFEKKTKETRNFFEKANNLVNALQEEKEQWENQN